MKIAIISEILNLKSGARAPIEMARSLNQLNDTSVIFYAYNFNKEEEAQEYLEKNQVRIKLFDSKPNILGRIKAVFWLFSDLKKEKPDIISGHATLAFYLAAFFSRRPLFSTYYGTQLNILAERKFPLKLNLAEKLTEKCLNFIIEFKTRLIFIFSKKQIAISKYTAHEAEKLYGQKINYIYLGAISPTLKSNSLPHSDASVTLLSVSRFTPYKGFHHLVEIFKELNKKFPKLKLVIAGSLGSINYVQYLKKIKNDNCQVVIDPKDKDLTEIYQKADIYVSLDQFLFFGMPILEAASFSLPTVALNRAAASELVIPDQTGYLGQDMKELGSYLEKLIADQNLRQNMGEKAEIYAQKFTWEKTALEYQKEFYKLISKNT